MIRAAVIAGLLVAACRSREHAEPAPAPAPPASQPPAPTPPPIDRDALLAGKLPEGAPETELINAQCRICHSEQYVTQQRLSPAAWKKTIDKMRKFGAVLDDEKAASLAAFAARYWTPDLPPRTWALGPLPAGALPTGSP